MLPKIFRESIKTTALPESLRARFLESKIVFDTWSKKSPSIFLRISLIEKKDKFKCFNVFRFAFVSSHRLFFILLSQSFSDVLFFSLFFFPLFRAALPIWRSTVFSFLFFSFFSHFSSFCFFFRTWRFRLAFFHLTNLIVVSSTIQRQIEATIYIFDRNWTNDGEAILSTYIREASPINLFLEAEAIDPSRYSDMINRLLSDSEDCCLGILLHLP